MPPCLPASPQSYLGSLGYSLIGVSQLNRVLVGGSCNAVYFSDHLKYQIILPLIQIKFNYCFKIDLQLL